MNGCRPAVPAENNLMKRAAVKTGQYRENTNPDCGHHPGYEKAFKTMLNHEQSSICPGQDALK
jgi:hypothetical protein